MESIKKQIIKGTIYNGLGKYLTIICNIVITAVLARLLPPSDFGLVALTSVVIVLFDLFADIGFGPAIIQDKQLTDEELSDVFSYSILFSFFLLTIYLLLVPLISTFYNEPQISDLLYFLSLHLFFNTLCIVPRALMLKQKMFKKIAAITVTNIILWGIVAIILAYNNGGVFSLVVISVGTSISSLFFYLSYCNKKIKILLKPSYTPIKRLLSFSMYQFAFNLVNYFSRNLDKILIGKSIGMSELGYYEKSYRLMTLPLTSLTQVMTPTIQPILSNFQNQKTVIYNVYAQMTRFLLFCGAMLTPFLFFSSTELILIAFGKQWIAAIPIFEILSLSVIFQLVDSLSGAFLQASNSPKNLFVSGLICSILNVCFLLIGIYVFEDILSVSVFITIALLLNLFVSIYYIVYKTFNFSILIHLKLFLKPFLLMAILFVLLHFVSLLKIEIYVLLFIKLIITIITGGLFILRTNYLDLPFINSLILKKKH